jgi:hypothetical protein
MISLYLQLLRLVRELGLAADSLYAHQAAFTKRTSKRSSWTSCRRSHAKAHCGQR